MGQGSGCWGRTTGGGRLKESKGNAKGGGEGVRRSVAPHVRGQVCHAGASVAAPAQSDTMVKFLTKEFDCISRDLAGEWKPRGERAALHTSVLERGLKPASTERCCCFAVGPWPPCTGRPPWLRRAAGGRGAVWAAPRHGPGVPHGAAAGAPARAAQGRTLLRPKGERPTHLICLPEVAPPDVKLNTHPGALARGLRRADAATGRCQPALLSGHGLLCLLRAAGRRR